MDFLEPLPVVTLPVTAERPENAERYTLYGFSACPYCAELREYLDTHGIPYDYIAVEDPDERQRLYKEVWKLSRNYRSMPQLFFGGVQLGGLRSVKAEPIETLRGLLA